jgi:hypothetical protein
MAAAAISDEILIESQENYLKQSYRNRCMILSANGVLSLSVPVLQGSFHKTPLKDIRIDYSKRWQQVHLGAITSSYRTSPFYDFYFDRIYEVINAGHNFLFDLNMNSLAVAIEITGIKAELKPTSEFTQPVNDPYDLRYSVSPKKRGSVIDFRFEPYSQVFADRFGFIQGLSIIDLIFNAGPDSRGYLLKTVRL